MADERSRVMIFRRNPRVIANACLTCGSGRVLCESLSEYESQRCCEYCDHCCQFADCGNH